MSPEVKHLAMSGTSISQSGVLRSVSPVKVREVQILGPHPTPTKSEMFDQRGLTRTSGDSSDHCSLISADFYVLSVTH